MVARTEALRLLELSSGASMAQVRQAWRDLLLVWHPDRLPERLQARATRKVQQLNEAYEYLTEHGPAGADREDLVQVICPRCSGTGAVTSGVSEAGHFEHNACPICRGVGALIAVADRRCEACDGRGRTDAAGGWAAYLRDRLSAADRGSPTYRLRYRRLWVRYENRLSVCKSCSGAGFTFYRPEGRRADASRRTKKDATVAVDRRKGDRRKRPPSPR